MAFLAHVARGALTTPLFSPLAHWFFGATAPGASVADLSGNGYTLSNLTPTNPRIANAKGCVGSYSIMASGGYRTGAIPGMNLSTSVEIILSCGTLGSWVPLSAPGYAIRVVVTTGVGFVWQQGNGGVMTVDTGGALLTKFTGLSNVAVGLLHMVFTRGSDGQTIKQYVNGKLIGTQSLAALGSAPSGNTEIGLLYGTGFVNNSILTAIWNTTLTDAQILHVARNRLGFAR